jgi:hypothetical protein
MLSADLPNLFFNRHPGGQPPPNANAARPAPVNKGFDGWENAKCRASRLIPVPREARHQ